jgi:N6-L-threonylcarbamoyladenine synthase
MAAGAELGVYLITVSGGVSCNSRLRQRIGEAVERAGKRVLLAQPALTTDNAAMIGYVGVHRFREDLGTDLALDADPNLTLANT